MRAMRFEHGTVVNFNDLMQPGYTRVLVDRWGSGGAKLNSDLIVLMHAEPGPVVICEKIRTGRP